MGEHTICVFICLKRFFGQVTVFGEEPQTSQSESPSAVMKIDKFGVLQKESSGSAMASKPGVATRATGGATGSGATAGGSAPTGTAGKVAAKAKAEVERLRMLIVEVGFRLFVRDVTRAAAYPLIHHAPRSSHGSARFFFTALICQTFLACLSRHQRVLHHAGVGSSPHTDFLSNPLLLLGL